MNRVLNNKGFTLIELLAVITIMGILMMVAIPGISGTIYSSKKKTFATTANAYIKDVKNRISQNEYETPESGQSLIVPTVSIELDNGGNSPFTNEKLNGCVKVTNIGDNKYEYSFSGVDSAGNGIENWVTSSEIAESSNYSFVKKNTILKAKNCDSTKTSSYFVQGDGTVDAKISFTINDVTYTTTKGNTFGQWILESGGSSTGNSVVWVSPTAGYSDQEIKTNPVFNGGVWSYYKWDTRANGLYLSLYMETGYRRDIYDNQVLPTERFCKWDGNNHIYMTYSNVIEENGVYGGENHLLNNYCCFDAGTKVLMANGKEKNIEDVKAGEYVMSYNIETKQYEPNKVSREIIKHNSDDLVYVYLSNGKRIGMRAYHPLLTDKGYKSLRPDLAQTIMDVGYEVEKLKVGDILIGIKDRPRVLSIEIRKPIENYDTYNLSVENNHNYIANGVVVHNAGCPT